MLAEELMQRRILAIAVLIAASSVVSQAQKQASCTFNLFQLNPTNPINPSTQPNGVTDKATVVGQASFQSTPTEGFIRYPDGTVRYYSAPNAAATYFTDRNVNAISIGVYSTKGARDNIAKGFMLNGKDFTSIEHPKSVWGTHVQGINKWNTVVGWYLDRNETPHSFKRLSNGTFVTLSYPGPGETGLAGINDNGMIVGNHSDARAGIGDGVVYYNGKWATLNYPGPLGTTALFGVSDAGVIVGESSGTESETAFLYKNGIFKRIAVPSSFATQVQGISPDGLITGYVLLTGNENSQHGFTARCK
jgi:probable HAF family extracellular repeat protein